MARRFIAVFITCASKKEAKKIIYTVIRKRLAGCAAMGAPVESLFWWKGNVCKAKEVPVVFKTEKRHLKDIEREVKRLHSYEVPEVVALPITGGSKKYLDWLAESVEQGQ